MLVSDPFCIIMNMLQWDFRCDPNKMNYIKLVEFRKEER